MAEEFNQYFSSCATKLASDIPASDDDPLRHVPESTTTFCLHPVEETKVLSELLKLKTKKSTGLDKIPAKLLKDSAPVIVKPLTHIFNLSMSMGEVPNDWKMARVSPIHKAGKRDNVSNYRPVSVLNVASKVMERIVHNQISHFMDRNGLLTAHQSGFRKHHSTGTAVQKVVEDIKSAFNAHKVTVALFLDLRKAFDTVNHEILLGKLQKMGFDSGTAHWFRSYLTDRFQCVDIQNKLSALSRVTCGVPQGSVLGPLLFCIYTNDLPKVVRKCSIHMYADDTVIYYSASLLNECEDAVSEDMRRAANWFKENRLSLHPDKTKSMVFGLPQKLRHTGKSVSVTDGLNTFEQVDSFTYLGVTMDPSLQWAPHVEMITRKLLAGLGALRRAKPFVTKGILQLMCRTLLYSHLDYCSTAWLPSLLNSNKSKMIQLNRLINRAARIITGSKLKDHKPIESLLAEAGMEPLTGRVKENTLVTVYKAVRNKAPPYLTQMFKWMSPPVLKVRTRAAAKQLADWDPHLLTIPQSNVQSFKGSLQFQGPTLWNELSIDRRRLTGVVPGMSASIVLLATSVLSCLGCVYLAYILYFILQDACIVCISTYVINTLLLIVNIKRVLIQRNALLKKKQ
ncbi:VKORC1L1 [Branchiostoma lanceolatum]|uniref:VKORC1L1 protein n=1 Tax=Branchiostoma lanceolatum TaxID=7740 RepID=A0A8J9YQD6_BRALA|nr:VKORC1L1 [Branchiostoma lanceolatum]